MVLILIAALGVGLLAFPSNLAQRPSAPVIKVCGLLAKADVKSLIGGGRIFDMFPPEEEAIPGGSSCNYGGVLVQVMAFSQGTIDALKKLGPLEAISGVGDEAYLRNNPAGYAELFAKVGSRILTLQRDLDPGKTTAAVKPGVVALAKAYVAKLR